MAVTFENLISLLDPSPWSVLGLYVCLCVTLHFCRPSLAFSLPTSPLSLLFFIFSFLPPTPPIPYFSSRTRGPCSLRTSGIWCDPSFSSCSDRRPSPSNSGLTCSRKRSSLLCPFSLLYLRPWSKAGSAQLLLLLLLLLLLQILKTVA